MPIVVSCPSCSSQLRVSDELLGRKVRCPSCQTIFEAKAPPSADKSAPLELDPTRPQSKSRSSEEEKQADSSSQPKGPGIKLTLDDDEPPPPKGKAEAKIRKEALPPAEDEEEDEPQRSKFTEDLKDCPECGAQVHRDLSRCNRCGAELKSKKRRFEDEEDKDDRPSRRRKRRYDDDYDDRPVRRDCEPHRGGLILTLGILSLTLPALALCCHVFGTPIPITLGIIAWVMGSADMRKINSGRMDPSGRGITQAGYICGIIGTCISTLLLLLCGGILILQFTIVGLDATRQGGPKFGPPIGQPGRKF